MQMDKLTIDLFLEEALKRNQVKQVHPEVLKRAIEIVKRCYNENIFVLFTDGYRSNIEQAILYGKGRASYIYEGKQYGNPKEKIVTNAPPGNSLHNYGLAIDFVLSDGFGKNILWDVNDKWKRVAAIAKEIGFDWGGDWIGFIDYSHFEYTGGLTLGQIKNGLLPVFKPYPSLDINELKFTSSTLKNKVQEFLTNRQLQQVIIDEGIKKGAFGAVWKEKHNNGEISNGDYIGLYMLYYEKK